MRPKGSQEQLERRRRQAVALRKQGFGPAAIARRLKATPQSVCRWLRRHRRGGAGALAARPVSGRPPRLTARQKRGLASCLLKGASAFGFATDLWTWPRIAQLIAQRYGAHYHVDAILRLVTGLGVSRSGARTSGRRK